MENNNTELAYSDFDLHECIRRVIIANMSQLDDKHMDLQLSFEDEPMYVHADADQIEQVLVNLLSNAVKYTPEGGHIAIDTAQEGKLTYVSLYGVEESKKRLAELTEAAKHAIEPVDADGFFRDLAQQMLIRTH